MSRPSAGIAASRIGRVPHSGVPRLAAAFLLLVAGLAAGIPLVSAVLLWLASAAPGAEAAGTSAGVPASLPSPGGTPGEIATRTIVWAVAAAAVAVLVGWLPGRRLGRSVGVRRSLIAAAILLPVSIPAYAIYHAWWQAWPVGSQLHAWIAGRDMVPAARAVTLAVAFAAWSWPIVALCVAPAAAAHDGRRDQAMRLDRVGGIARGRLAARREWPAAMLGGLVVLVLVASNTTAFDLAQVYAIGNELRAMDALGRPPRELLAVGGPFLLLTIAGTAVAWAAARPPRPGGRHAAAAGTVAHPGRTSTVVLGLVLLVGLGVPLGLAAGGLPDALDVRTFLRLNGEGFARSLSLAAVVAALVAGLAVLAGLALAGGVRWPVTTAAVLLLLALLAPGFVFVAGAEAAWNRGWFGGDPRHPLAPASLVFRTPMILVLAGIARAAAPALLLARWAVDARPPAARELARLDRPRGVLGRLRELGPRLAGAAVAAAALAFVLVLADASVVARMAPAGFDPIAGTLLNAMHYQRTDTVILGLVVIIAAAGVAALALALGTGLGRHVAAHHRAGTARRRRRRLRLQARTTSVTRRLVPMLLLPVVLVLAGCLDPGEPDAHGVLPLPSPVVHGESGTAPGQFSYPRAMAADPERDRVYVIDKTARVQAFDGAGRHVLQWRMPEFDQGKPSGVSVGPDGTVWVADTHENRVMAFSPEGRELLRFGGPGTGPGEFVYSTDVAVAADGRLFVSEYGGNDRIQVFEPDGTYVRGFGTFGTGDGAFNRPQALLFSPDRTRLYVADSCNHRIVVVDPETGAFESIIGEAGTGPGQFHYPYDITWFDEDVLLVSEFGNNRIQLVRTDGTSLGRFGGVGAEPGRLKYPWGAVRVGGSVHVLDSGNNRLQEVPARRLR